MAGANDTIRCGAFSLRSAWFDRASHPTNPVAAIIIVAIAARRRVAAFNLTQRNYPIGGAGLSTHVNDAVCIHVSA
ncbi:MAG TPA: hypothetical protein VN742_03855 [Candidatus Binataceae bacterium]|nr:hypothetical protein [Candidatus Binataceae bacterium]